MRTMGPAPIKEGNRDALHYLLEAWDQAVENGIAPSHLAYSAIYVALTDLVAAYGESAVGEFADGLAARIRKGEFTTYHWRQ